MADLNYRVTVNTQDAQRSIAGLRTALGGLAAAFSIRQIVSFADSITNLQNKLSLVSKSTADTQRQFKALAAIAIEARTDLTATGDLYFRIARASRELGISQQEAAQITESLAKAMTASGLSAAESAGPLLQLGQALQSGRFQGDELRSILEGLPPVAEALAKGMGVPIGELRRLGAEGKITGTEFVNAMRQARDAIERDFAKTVPTISQAFNELRTNVAFAFDEFEKSTQAGQSLAQAIQVLGFLVFKFTKFIAENGETLLYWAKVIATVITSLLGLKIIHFLMVTIGSFSKLIASLLPNLSKFGEKGKFVTEVMATLVSTFGIIAGFLGIGAQFEKLTNYFKSFGDATSDNAKEMADYRSELEEYKKALSDISGPNLAENYNLQEKAKLMAQVREELEQTAQGYYDTANAQLVSLRRSNSLIGAGEERRNVIEALSEAERNYFKEAQRLQEELTRLQRSSREEDKANIPVIIDLIDDLDLAYIDQLKSVKALADEQNRLTAARQLELFTTGQQLDTERELRKIQDDIAKLTMTEIERKYYDIAAAARESAKAAIEAEEARRGRPLSASEVEQYYKVARENAERLREATERHNEANRRWSTGWQKAMRDYADEAGNAAKRAETVFKKATQGMEDAIVNFAKTGKFEFKSFVASMLEELLRSQVRQAMASIFNIGTSGGGTVGGGIGSLFGGFFATGGMIPPGRFGVVGERGPELVQGPADVTPMAPMQVTYNISAVDARSFKALIAEDPSFIHAVAMQGGKSMPGRR